MSLFPIAEHHFPIFYKTDCNCHKFQLYFTAKKSLQCIHSFLFQEYQLLSIKIEKYLTGQIKLNLDRHN